MDALTPSAVDAAILNMRTAAAHRGQRVEEDPEGGTVRVLDGDGRLLFQTTRHLIATQAPTERQRKALNRRLAYHFWREAGHGGFW